MAGSDTRTDIDTLVTDLAAGEQVWTRTSLTERRQLLLEVGSTAHAHADEWVRIAAEIKQLDPTSPLVGEEWISGPYALIGYIQALQDTLARLAAGADVLAGYRVDTAPDGRLAIQVLPHQIFDTLLLNGFRAEVWTTPGVTEAQLRAGAALLSGTRSGPTALPSCWAPATSSRSLRWTSCTSCTPRTEPSCSS